MKQVSLSSVSTLIAVFLLTLSVSVQAQTPDGETPAEEEICSELSGAAFGLCNAYCEAMDCDYVEPQASEQACQRVRDNFLKITGDELFPCDESGPICDNIADGVCHAGCFDDPDFPCDL